MNARPSRWIAPPILFLFVTGASALTLPLTVSGPTPTAQVGVPYSSALSFSPLATSLQTPFYGISGLPPGLSLNSATGAITGTPTTAGTYTLTGWVSGSVTIMAGGFPVLYSAYGQAEFTITVSPPVDSVPTSPWALALVMLGLAGAGLLRLGRQCA